MGNPLLAGLAKRFAIQARYPDALAMERLLLPGTVTTPALQLIATELDRCFRTPGGRLIISIPPQEGKALALDTPIPTPAGWTTMGDLQPGDQVYDRHGKPCNVTAKSPVWTGRPCYRVTTGDGESIVADAAHEWVARLDRRSSERIVETTTLARQRTKNAQITAGAVLQAPDAVLPVDPYTLGVWLGDGNTAAAKVYCHPDDREILDRTSAAGWPARKTPDKYGWRLSEPRPAVGPNRSSRFRAALVAAGVWGNKHVPDAYLRASAAQRLALLQGLVDTDGYVMPKGQVEFCSTNQRLAAAVEELVYSLGGKAVTGVGRATLYEKDCGPKYRVRFYLAGAAHLKRKAARCKDSSVSAARYVTAVPCSSEPTVCIEVDSPDHTFLAGRTMLPTHNSSIARAAAVRELATNPDTRIVIASYAMSLAQEHSRWIRDAITMHSDELGIQVKRGDGALTKWGIEGARGGIVAAGVGSGLTGKSADIAVIDDPVKDQEDADSEVMREKAWGWWTSVLSTRLQSGSPVVLIMTRWHMDDLAGRLIANDEDHRWRVLNIPAQADAADDPLGRAPGEYLISAKRHKDGSPRTTAEWEAIRRQAGSRVWNALYQGRPSPEGGGIIKDHWWRYYASPLWTQHGDVCTAQGMDEVLVSADLTFKDGRTSDYVAIGVWGRAGANAFLLDQVRDRMDFVAALAAFKALCKRWPQATLKLVEDKANGPALISMLSREIPGIVPVQPQGGKQARAHAVVPFIEAGNVHLPAKQIAPWVEDFVSEASAFPTGAHDDQVDQTTQALDRLLLRPLDAPYLDPDQMVDYYSPYDDLY